MTFYNSAIETFYLFFQGILSFQVLVFAALYFLTKRKDLLYYCLFLFFATVYFFVNAPYTFFRIAEDDVWNSSWYDKVNDLIIIVQNLFYLLFLKAFFTNIVASKKVERLFGFSLLVIPVLIFIFLLFTLLKLDKEIIYYLVQLIPVIPAIFVATAIIKNNFPFAGLVANGLLCNILGTCLTVFMNVLRNYGVHHLFTEGYPLFFVRVGILADMIFFLAAILKKWHFQEKQLAIEKLQSQLGVEQMRNKISGELHDNLGSSLSGISMYSYMVENLLSAGDYEQAKRSISVIQKSVDDMTSNLSDLAWSIKPGQDALQKLIQKLEEYAMDMAAAKNMRVIINLPEHLHEQNVPMESRRNIYLFCKEAINNAVKYSNGSLLELNISEKKDNLEFSVTDDGEGFDLQTVRRGNGLENMQKRAEEIGAKLTIESKHGQGSILAMQIKIT